MWHSNLDYSKFGPMSYAPLDDDYLEYEGHHKSEYNYEDEWDEDEAVEEYYIDPLRLAKEKVSHAAATA